MTITDQAPYAPSDAVIRVLETFRETGFGGGPIDTTLLARMSFGPEIARRIVQTLRILDLIDDAGKPTRNLTAFKQAPSDTYKQVFRDLLFDVYHPVFAITGKDLQGTTSSQVEDAFRTFKPDSLRKRMVTLFLGLCEYAGIVAEAPKSKPGPKPSGSRASGSRANGQSKSSQSRRQPNDAPADPPPPPEKPRPDPLIAAYFDKLPPSGSEWSSTERTDWLNALDAIFKIVYKEPAS